MTDRIKSGEHSREHSRSSVDASSQRLDGADAMLTAEWDVRAMFWPPESEQKSNDATDRSARPAAAAVEPEKSPIITLPKPVRIMSAPPAPVIVALDLAATLPPKQEREKGRGGEPERSVPSELPSVERDAVPVEGTFLTRVALRHWPLAALGVLLSTATIYSASSRLVSSEVDTSEPLLPEFLREPPAGSGALLSAEGTIASSPPPPPPPPPPLSPELASALGTVSAGAVSTADAGAPLEAPQAPRHPPAPVTLALAAAAPRAMLAPPLAATNGASSSSPPPSPPKIVTVAKTTPIADQPSRSTERTASKSTAAPARPAPPPAVRPLTTYTYGDKALFAVTTAPMRVTDLVLEPGEKLVSRPTAGDAARWVISVVDSVSRGTPRAHVFVKPLRAGLRTNLTLTTDRRSYFLELSSSNDGAYMAGVEWDYPADAAERRRQALAEAARERQSTTAVSDLSRIRFDYRIETTAGSPTWKPTQVFDDGEKTFIRFPHAVTPSRAPVLFVLRRPGAKNAQFVNYRVKADLYVIERLVDAAELRLGPDDEGPAEVVRIIRK